MNKIVKTYSAQADAAIAARDAAREEYDKQRAERRRSQVELIRLHFACARLEGAAEYDNMYGTEEMQQQFRERFLALAWADADAFIKKGEQQ